MNDEPRFYDPQTGGRVMIQLEQLPRGDFSMLRSIGYRDAHHPDRPFIVPAAGSGFTTDLTSVPTVFLWLVPTVGTHLPAALLHDGLVYPEGGTKTYEGPDIGPEEADRVFRDAMRDLGVGRVRRWLIWTAVTLATAWSRLRPRWRWRGVLVLTLAIVVGLGIVATFDVLDVWDVLPWMGDRGVWAEVVGGAAGAIVIPALLSLLWGRLWRAGLIAGVALALLIHVTAAVAVVLGVYMVAEWLLSWREGLGPGVRRNLGVPTDDRPSARERAFGAPGSG